MGCLTELLKVAAGLFGAVLSIAGVVAFIAGIVIGAVAVFGDNSGGLPLGCALVVGGIVVVTIGTILGKFAAGFYD